MSDDDSFQNLLDKLRHIEGQLKELNRQKSFTYRQARSEGVNVEELKEALYRG